jgi:hypothetical protein
MKLYNYIIMAMVAFCSLNASEHKPTLNTFVYENTAEENDAAEVIFMSEFKQEEPTLLPFAHSLSVAETFIQAAQMHGIDLSNLFKETDQSREIGEHISQLDKAMKLRFVIPRNKLGSLIQVLDCISFMPEQVGKISRSIHEKTKSDLVDSIPYFKKSDLDDSSEEQQIALFKLTPIDLLNSWMNTHFSQSENALIIALPKNSSAEVESISEAIQKMGGQWEVVEHETSSVNNDLESIQPADKGVVIDGKIYMDSPAWWQKKTTGYFTGGFLLVIGLFLLVPTYGFSCLLIGISGSLLLSQNYLSDPTVIEKLRVEIYENGFYYANKKQCIGVTLTPHERRQLFIEEICDRQSIVIHTISDFAGYYALNCYDYHSIEMRSFLYSAEREQLVLIQRNYLANVENVKDQVAKLEAELQIALIPFQILRDASVESAYSEYNNCAAVVLNNILVSEYNIAKAQVQELWRKSEITTERRDEMLKNLKEEFSTRKAPLKPLINQAETYLNQRLAEIQAQYSVHVVLCKNNMNYDGRIHMMENIKWDMTSYYSKELSAYIIEVVRPVIDNFPDFLDLRTK